jgi:hypothetical protein
MKLLIDNLDGAGLRDYTSAIDSLHGPEIIRKKDRPYELHVSLLAMAPDFVVPSNGARITLGRANGSDVFTGYISKPPQYEYLGYGNEGPVYRYNVVARSDEFLLDQRTIPERAPFVARTAGQALCQLTEDLLPGAFDTSGVEELDTLSWYSVDRRRSWSEHAAEIALRARACYRILDGKISFKPVGSQVHYMSEMDSNFRPEGLKLQRSGEQVNDLIVLGRMEPQVHVKDYFVGDGMSLKFYLSQQPFMRQSQVLLDEEFKGNAPDPTHWTIIDPLKAVSVAAGKLQINGGTGVDGQTLVNFVEQVEMGGALVLQHGDLMLTSRSDGLIGGLYRGAVSMTNCVAGFRITPSLGTSSIQAFVNGTLSGPAVIAQLSHHYVLSTRLYASEVYRRQQTFHSSTHPAGSARGGTDISASVRIILELHEIDPSNPGSLVAPATVLFDDVIPNAPSFCNYTLVNSANLHCNIAFTRMLRTTDVEVRTALPPQPYRTRLAGSLSDGAECRILSDPSLQFFPQCVPAAKEQIVVRYQGFGRAMARVGNPAEIANSRRGLDDGIHGAVRELNSPPARTAIECETAALALLDDCATQGWSGEYQTWSDFLPGDAEDIFPGDTIHVDVPSREARFDALVREVRIEAVDLKHEHCLYTIRFADEAAEPLAFEFGNSRIAEPLNMTQLTIESVGNVYLADLTAAEITEVTSTSVSIGAGTAAPTGGGFEVRSSDYGWGQENDRNLMGRFTSTSFTLPRLGRTQTYFLRQYDSSSPVRYSRYSTALHLDWPL